MSADLTAASPKGGGSPLDADREWLRFSYEGRGALDVYFDDRRVWSVSTEEATVEPSGRYAVRWPRVLHDRLEGWATVELRAPAEDRVVAAGEVRFGTGEGRVALVDSAGRPLAVTKYGRFNRPFESLGREVVEGYLDQVEQVITVLREACRLPAFICYGTLLGAVRSGRLIGHDVDVDLGYLSDFEHPVDVVRENMRVERALRARGFRLLRPSGGFIALLLPQEDGSQRNLDVFASFIVRGELYQSHDVRTPADRSAVVPVRDIELEGRMLPAPARPEVFLEAAYGRSWEVPDPSFRYETPRPLKRRINGWLGGLRAQRDRWARFYGGHSRDVPQVRSPFAQWVAAREEPQAMLFDVGCGNGRDAFFFAKHGFTVEGVDMVTPLMRKLQSRAERGQLPVTFSTWNLYSVRDTLTAGALAAHRPGPKIVYARFLLHTLTDEGRENFWRYTRLAIGAGDGRCYLEFRTKRDRARPKHFTHSPHRQFLDPEQVVAEATRHGATVVHRQQGTGLARFRGEDPHVCRLVLEWRPRS